MNLHPRMRRSRLFEVWTLLYLKHLGRFGGQDMEGVIQVQQAGVSMVERRTQNERRPTQLSRI